MAAIFAHEVASPLNGISATVQLIGITLPEQFRPLMFELNTEIRRLESLLNHFRSLSRLDALKRGPVNLVEVVRRVLEINAPYWSNLDVRIITEVSGDLTLSADEEKLHQMALNLCRNAVEAMPDGGTLSIKAYQDGGEVVLKIGDSGCGVPEDFDIFQPFTTNKANGSGLGLHVVRQIVAAHAGVISYRSEKGTATTFEVRLPKVPLR